MADMMSLVVRLALDAAEFQEELENQAARTETTGSRLSQSFANMGSHITSSLSSIGGGVVIASLAGAALGVLALARPLSDVVRRAYEASGSMAILQDSLGAIRGRVVTAIQPAMDRLGSILLQSLNNPAVQAGINNIIIAVGNFASTVVGAVPGIIQWFQNVSDWLTDHQGVIVAVLGALGVAVAVFVYTTVVPAMIAMAASVAAATWPFLLVAGVIYLLYQAWTTNFLGIQDVMATVWGFLQGVFQGIVNFFTVDIPAAILSVSNFWINILLPAFQSVADFVRNIFNLAFSNLGGIFQTRIIPALTTIFGWLHDHLQPVFEWLGDFINNVMVPAFEGLGRIIEGVIAFIQQIVTWIGNLIDAIGNLGHAAGTGGGGGGSSGVGAHSQEQTVEQVGASYGVGNRAPSVTINNYQSAASAEDTARALGRYYTLNPGSGV